MRQPPLQNVIVPWRNDPRNSMRLAAYNRVTRHLLDCKLYPLSPAVLSDAWSPGLARNAGARIALDDVLVFNDADTITPRKQIESAIRSAASSGSLVYAYTVYQREDDQGRVERELINPPSMGCAAIRADRFKLIGGFDERFVGWGYEDVEFARRCQAELGPILRIDGTVRHLYHGSRFPDDSPVGTVAKQVKANLDLMGEIQAGRVAPWPSTA